MNISQLRTFVAVIDHGSLSAAARSLGISQPAVTMQLQALEADLDATLLDRRYRGIDLTEAGEVLLPHARRTLADLDSARSDIARLSETVGGHLRIAASTTPAAYLVPRVLGGFLSTHPNVGVTIVVQDSTLVIESIEQGRADLGVTGAVSKGACCTFTEIESDELVVICAPDNLLASSKNVPLAALAAADWIMREPGSGTRRVAENALAERGLEPSDVRVVVELGSGEAVVSAVEGGLGIAMLSQRVAEKALKLGTVNRVQLKGPAITRPLYSVLPKGTPIRAASVFAEYLAGVTTNHG